MYVKAPQRLSRPAYADLFRSKRCYWRTNLVTDIEVSYWRDFWDRRS